YTYVAYPWIVSLLPARLARPGAGPGPRLISILIAARDPGGAVAEKVAELLEAVPLESEVVIVLDGPDPAAVAALAALADDRVKVRVLERPQGKAAALNYAVAMSRGEVLVFTDVRSGSDATELARKVRTLTGNYQLIAWMPWVLHPGKNRVWWQFMSHKVLRLLTPLAVSCFVAGLLLVFGPWAGVVGLGGITLPWMVRPASVPGGGVLRVARSGIALLAALVVAALNAARGRWDVWGDPARPTF